MIEIIVIAAPSGSGKTTIIEHLLKNNANLEFSISATSRKPRKNEQNGVDYYFISAEEFRNKISNNEFLEWEEVYEGNYYGSPQSEVDRITKLGKTAMFDVDVVGALNIKKKYPNAFLIFVVPPSLEVLKERLEKRHTDSDEEISKRLQKAKEELSRAKEFDYILLNDELEEAIEEIDSVVSEYLKNKLVPGTFRIVEQK
ncbi:MAG: guanylate kinase [Prevotellaceae bacterium]|jgi:guanylate kinase|nr:guanylate kinase [Prevotellaceae bacterium]